MRSLDVKKWGAIALVFIGLLVVMGAEPWEVFPGEDDWLGAMTRAVVAEQGKEGPWMDVYAPYVAQLKLVRVYLLKDDTNGVYRAMNRLMDMFERRENGISAEVADRLFDYCYLVTPARYHDVSRHIEKLMV